MTSAEDHDKEIAEGRRPQGRPVRHGLSGSPTYEAWVRMKQLCEYPSSSGYKYVGGKGVGYDPAWASFDRFLADMGEAPEGHSLKRIKPRADYSRTNCEWRPIRRKPKE